MAHVLTSVKGADVDAVPIKRALISVFDKTNLIELAQYLAGNGVQLLSTGGTAKKMRDAGLEVMDVSEYTKSPEILDGRVKTLHPTVHGGLLAVRGNAKHEAEMEANGINAIDLVVMNLYPFEQCVADGGSFDMCIENIDIGGPSMLRSSAKNHKYVTIVTSPSQYDTLMQEMSASDGCTTLSARRKFASRAFATSAAYDTAIATYFAEQLSGVSNCSRDDAPAAPATAVAIREYEPIASLKYGCNPHQKPAAMYKCLGYNSPFDVINGMPGYINLLDACNAWQLVTELRKALDMPAAASFKHCSPAGAAVGIPLTPAEVAAYEITSPETLTTTALAYVRARQADPMCSFGDFAAVSHVVDEATALVLKTSVCDGIIAPGFEPSALSILKKKKKGAFVILQADLDYLAPVLEFREVYGLGFSQKRNDAVFTPAHLDKVVAGTGPMPGDAVRDLVVATISIKYTQSNSVGYALRGQMIGVGAGQQSRVDCVKLAGRKVCMWYLRQHPKVQGLKFKASVKKQDRINARVRYIEGDIMGPERPVWEDKFEEVPAPLTDDDKAIFMKTLNDDGVGVALSSDAFFPFRDSIDHASVFGVKYIAQAGGSIADDEVIGACNEYGMTMAFTGLRLFHH